MFAESMSVLMLVLMLIPFGDDFDSEGDGIFDPVIDVLASEWAISVAAVAIKFNWPCVGVWGALFLRPQS